MSDETTDSSFIGSIPTPPPAAAQTRPNFADTDNERTVASRIDSPPSAAATAVPAVQVTDASRANAPLRRAPVISPPAPPAVDVLLGAPRPRASSRTTTVAPPPPPAPLKRFVSAPPDVHQGRKEKQDASLIQDGTEMLPTPSAAQGNQDFSKLGSSSAAAPSENSGLVSIDDVPWGDLRLTRLIGSGGFGEVYAGFWGGTPVAIKRVKVDKTKAQSAASDALAREAFLAEVRVLAAIRHPNCLQLLCTCTTPPNLAIVTEYMRGGDLADLLFAVNRAIIADSKKLSVALQIAQGLEYLHRKNIIHRDLKPQNILVDETLSVVKVGDFGLASLLQTLLQSGGRIVGTPRYMAPEIYLGDPASAASDIFSFGVILWEIITQTKAYNNVDRTKNFYSHPGALAAEFTNGSLKALCELSNRCLSPDAANRPTCAEVVRDILGAIESNVLCQLFPSVPTMPVNNVARPQDLEAIKAGLTGTGRPARRQGGGASDGVVCQGMGGVGKSQMAMSVVHDEDLRRLFKDGVHWVTLGQSPDIGDLQADLLKELGVRMPETLDVDSMRAQLVEAFSTRRSLIVLDDIWNASHFNIFDVGGPRCSVLVTTRDIGLAQSLGLTVYPLNCLDALSSLRVLAQWAQMRVENLPAVAAEVAKNCGYLPLALAMVGAVVRGKPVDVWDTVKDTLAAEGGANKQEGAGAELTLHMVVAPIRVSIQALNALRYRYYDLAVFPEDSVIPLSTLLAMWGELEEPLNEADTRGVVDTFKEKSLVLVDDQGDMRLHDLPRQYLISRALDTNTITKMHKRLLWGYSRRCSRNSSILLQADIKPDADDPLLRGDEFGEIAWESVPDDGYIHQRLFSHMTAAGALTSAASLLLHYPWLQRKFDLTRFMEAVIEDFTTLEAALDRLSRASASATDTSDVASVSTAGGNRPFEDGVTPSGSELALDDLATSTAAGAAAGKSFPRIDSRDDMASISGTTMGTYTGAADVTGGPSTPSNNSSAAMTPSTSSRNPPPPRRPSRSAADLDLLGDEDTPSASQMAYAALGYPQPNSAGRVAGQGGDAGAGVGAGAFNSMHSSSDAAAAGDTSMSRDFSLNEAPSTLLSLLQAAHNKRGGNQGDETPTGRTSAGGGGGGGGASGAPRAGTPQGNNTSGSTSASVDAAAAVITREDMVPLLNTDERDAAAPNAGRVPVLRVNTPSTPSVDVFNTPSAVSEAGAASLPVLNIAGASSTGGSEEGTPGAIPRPPPMAANMIGRSPAPARRRTARAASVSEARRAAGSVLARDLAAVSGALSLSGPAVVNDGRQLWFQLAGRLKDMADRSPRLAHLINAAIEAQPENVPLLVPRESLLEAPNGACIKVLRSISERTDFVCLSPGEAGKKKNGARLAWISKDLTSARVWDTVSCTDVATIRSVDGNLKRVCMSPDGRSLITQAANSHLRVWDLDTNKSVAVYQMHRDTAVKCLCTNGTTTVSVDEKKIHIWRNKNAGQVTMLPSARATCVGIHREIFAIGSQDGAVYFGKCKSVTVLNKLDGHHLRVECVIFCGDGSLLLSAAFDQTIIVWSMVMERQVLALDCTCRPHSVACSLDGRVIAAGLTDSTVQVWSLEHRIRTKEDASNLARESFLVGHSAAVHAIHVMPDGKHVLTADKNNMVRLWAKAAMVMTPVEARSNSRRRNTIARNPRATQRNPLADVYPELFRESPSAYAMSRDGMVSACAVGDDPAQIFVFAPSEQKSTTLTRILLGHQKRVAAMEITGNCEFLFSAGWQGIIHIYALDLKNKVSGPTPSLHPYTVLRGHTGAVRAMALDHGRGVLYSAGSDKTIIAWSIPDGRRIHTFLGHTSLVRGLAVDPVSGVLASASINKNVRFWSIDARTEDGGSRCHTELLQNVCTAMAFSEELGVLGIGQDDGAIRIYTGFRELFTTPTSHPLTMKTELVGHTQGVSCMTVVPGGRLMISGGDGGRMLLWDLELNLPQLQPLSLYYFDAPVASIKAGADKVLFADRRSIGPPHVLRIVDRTQAWSMPSMRPTASIQVLATVGDNIAQISRVGWHTDASNVTCTKCGGVEPGPRYKCLDCQQGVSLCSACYHTRGRFHNARHNFLRRNLNGLGTGSTSPNSSPPNSGPTPVLSVGKEPDERLQTERVEGTGGGAGAGAMGISWVRRASLHANPRSVPIMPSVAEPSSPASAAVPMPEVKLRSRSSTESTEEQSPPVSPMKGKHH